MSKTLDSACFPATRHFSGRQGWKNLWLALALCAPAILQAQALQSWEDDFKNSSKIQSLVNANLDTVRGWITLTPIRQTVTQDQNFRAVLSGIDKLFVEPTRILDLTINPITVVDIDTVPGNEDVYLVTDQQTRRVFTYNAATGRIVNPDLGSGKGLILPQDAFAFIEGNNILKVLITDSEIDQVLKVNSTNNELEWFFSSGLLNPSDAVVLPGSREVLICDTGNNRIIAVDTTTDVVTWEFDTGVFNNPVDVDVDPTNPGRYLVTDQNRHRVVLVERASSSIVFQFGRTDTSGLTARTLTFPTDADPLPNGNILISDEGNNRLIEINRQGQIVWQFAQEVFSIRDADRIRSGTHRDKTIVALKDSAAAINVTAKRLVNVNEAIVLALKDFGQTVDFDSLRFKAILPSGTRIKLQLRTVDTPSDTTNKPFLGPLLANTFYTTVRTSQSPTDTVIVSLPINPVHDGDQFFQFLVRFETDDRLKTPELHGLEVKATYFRANTSGIVVSTIIRDSPDAIITAWRNLEFDTELPFADGRFIGSVIVDILNAAGDSALVPNLNAQSTPTTPYDISPDRVRALRGRQTLRLRGTLSTNSAFTSPKLLRWKIEWNSVKLGPSQTRFVNSSDAAVERYRVSSAPGDSVFVRVSDPNVLALRDSVQVQVRGSSGDAENIFLFLDPLTRAFFRNRVGLRLTLAAAPALNNRLLEVRDREVLIVSYVDPLDAGDTSSDTAVVFQNVRGTIQIESVGGTKLDSVSVGDFIHVRVLGETDRNISPVRQDTITAELFESRSTDRETIILVELSSGGVFNTGNFRTIRPIPLIRTGSPPGDDTLNVVPGTGLVTASFQDLPNEPPIQAFAPVRDIGAGILDISGKFAIEIAPNPYRVGRNSPIKLRAQVRDGSLSIRQVEIFNIAGEKITTLPEGSIRFGSTTMVRSNEGPVVAMNWWNILGDDSQPVATGTYFVKFHINLTANNGGATQVTALKKLVVIQQ